MSFTVYIIYSAILDKYYVGHTANLPKRISEHNEGISSFTSKASNWVVRYTEEFESRELARNRELAIKRKKSRNYIEWLIAKDLK